MKKIPCNIQQILNLLPHRYPFLLIDKITELTEQHIIGQKNVTINEPFFQGHFPNEPIMPGVLEIEAIAQTGGILVLSTVPDPENYLTYLLGVDSCRFKRKVIPGDVLTIKCKLLTDIKRGVAKMKGEIFVEGNIASSTELLAQIKKVN